MVLGLGNTLLADDGVGVHIVRRLSADAATPPWIRPVDGGTMGFRLTSLLRDTGAVLIIDAADLSAAPGTMRLLDKAALGRHVARTKTSSAHEAGLADLLGLMRLEDIVPIYLAVLAIQPFVVGWGDRLSAPVEAIVPPACMMVTACASEWRHA
jgi:hydrogenase maturation protease